MCQDFVGGGGALAPPRIRAWLLCCRKLFHGLNLDHIVTKCLSWPVEKNNFDICKVVLKTVDLLKTGGKAVSEVTNYLATQIHICEGFGGEGAKVVSNRNSTNKFVTNIAPNPNLCPLFVFCLSIMYSEL